MYIIAYGEKMSTLFLKIFLGIFFGKSVDKAGAIWYYNYRERENLQNKIKRRTEQ
jgi:hypothetical protein